MKTFASMLIAILACGHLARRQAPEPAIVDRDIAVYFSPDGHCLDAVAALIESARRSIDVQAFLLSTTRIARPLIDAHRRGVAVRVIFDRQQAEEAISLDESLVAAGIPVFYDNPAEGKAHNKVMIFDDATVLTGSFNFTLQASEKNAENMVVISGRPAIAAGFRRNFESRLAASEQPPHQAKPARTKPRR